MTIKCSYCNEELDLGVWFEKNYPKAKFYHTECKQKLVEKAILGDKGVKGVVPKKRKQENRKVYK